MRDDGRHSVAERQAIRTPGGHSRGRPTFILAVALALAGCTSGGGNAAHGKEIFAACAACHGPKAQGNETLGAPNIAGLPQWYVEGQLNAFLSGHRGTAPADATGRTMAAAVKTLLKSTTDVQDVAAYVSGLPPTKPTTTLTEGDPVQGKVDYQACSSCHGADGKGKLDVPPVTAQDDWYLLAQLRKYKGSLRGTNEGDLQASRMRAVSIPLSEKQMHDVIAYVRTLR